MGTTRRIEEVDVVIVGCGPVGALTANLLGIRGISTVVLERGTAAHGQPRAFSCDDEALRIYQAAGLLDQVAKEMYSAPVAEYVNGQGRPFAEIALSEVDFGFGHPPLQFFDQPRLEEALRAGLDRFDHVALRLGAELETLVQHDDAVSLGVRDVATGQLTQIRARYVLGCDGARSTTRTLAGIELKGSTYAEPWLAVSGDLPPDAIRVDRTRFVCDWRRPAFVSPATHGSYRMEFMLRPGEQPADMEAAVATLVAPYVDPERFTVRRAVVYTFHHLIARRWRSGRVFLLGDAAHQMPPFMGQGLCSGLRDAANLTWKLGLVLSEGARDSLLDTYEQERRPHTEQMANITVQMGRLFLARRRWVAWLRDVSLRGVQRLPRVRRFVRHFEFKPPPAHRRGLVAGARRPAGLMFPQPRVGTGPSAMPRPLDDVLGPDFTVIGPGVQRELADDERWGSLPVRFIGLDGTDDDSNDRFRAVVDVDSTLRAWFARHRVDAVILRPDRFVFAAARTADLTELPTLLRTALRPSDA